MTAAAPVVEAPAAPKVTTAIRQPAPAAAPVVGHGGAVIPPERISERVTREKQKWELDEYGTNDAAAIAKIRADRKANETRLQELSAAEEERRRAAMSEKEKLEADLAREREEKTALRTQLQEFQENTIIQQQSTEIQRLAVGFIDNDPEVLDFVLSKFAAHVKAQPADQLKRFTPRKIERWFAEYAEKHPKYAKPKDQPETVADKPPAAIAPEAKPPVRRVPITTSTVAKAGAPKPPPKPPEAGSTYKGKTPKPGLPNSMNAAELRQYAKDTGQKISWNPRD